MSAVNRVPTVWRVAPTYDQTIGAISKFCEARTPSGDVENLQLAMAMAKRGLACDDVATYVVDKRWLCRKHAGEWVLDMLTMVRRESPVLKSEWEEAVELLRMSQAAFDAIANKEGEDRWYVSKRIEALLKREGACDGKAMDPGTT